MTTRREWTFGSHRATLVGEDVLSVVFDGPTTLADAEAAIPVYREAASTRPVFLVADISRSSLDAQARKFLADNIKPEWFKGVLYVGANVMLRTISKALSVMVLFNAKTQYDVRFVATHADADEQIAKWREERERAA
jgi:hypothetical protein